MLEHARRFLELAVPTPSEGAYLNVHYAYVGDDGGKYWDGRATQSVDEAIRTINWLNSLGGKDIYVCMSTQARFEEKISKKGNKYKKAIRFQETVVKIQSLYADLDVKSPAKPDGYDSQQEALAAAQAFIKATGLPIPSAFVASGTGGFHMHWVLTEAVTREQWQPLADRLVAALQHHNIKCDTQCTIDSARILRVPETFNYKLGEPRPTSLMSLGEKVTYEVMAAALAQYEPAPKAAQSARVSIDPSFAGSAPAGTATANEELASGVENTRLILPIEDVAKTCGFVDRSLKTGGAANANPLWFMTASIATFVEDGRQALHKMSDKHPGYVPADTDLLYDRVTVKQKEKNLGWPTCSKIASYGAPECQTCPLLKHGKSPLNFVIKIDPPANEPDLTMPERYVRNADGIIMIRSIADDGSPTVLPVCHYPIYAGWLSSDPTWTLHFVTKTDSGRKSSIDIPCEVITAGKDTFSKYLGAKGFFCTDVQYKILKEFFVSWLQKLQEAKDSVITAAPFGWSTVDGKMEGFSYGGRVWGKDTDRPAANPNPVLAYQYTPKGTPEVWEQAAKIVYEQRRPALDAILSVAFAAPLVRFTGHRGLILNAYSPESGIGKTTTMKVSQAVWGHPVMAMQALDDTANSVLGKMGLVKSLPMYWDEIKSDMQVKRFCSIVFNMTGGREKTRMSQDAQLRVSGEWQTIMVSASNESLVDGMAREAGSTTAGLHRMFEYTVPPGNSSAADVAQVQRLIGKLEDNYGHAGITYAKFLGRHWARVEQEVADLNDALLREVTAKQEERIWVATMSVVLQGATYANEIGLTDIDLAGLKSFLLDVFYKNRADVEGSPTDLTNDDSAVQVLGEFLNTSRSRYTLITNRIWSSAGKPPKGSIMPLSDTSKLMELRIQIGKEDRMVRIASTYLTQWMSERGYSRVTWIRKMEQDFGLKKTNGILGGGTDIVGAKEQLLELDLNHAKLSQFVE